MPSLRRFRIGLALLLAAVAAGFLLLARGGEAEEEGFPTVAEVLLDLRSPDAAVVQRGARRLEMIETAVLLGLMADSSKGGGVKLGVRGADPRALHADLEAAAADFVDLAVRSSSEPVRRAAARAVRLAGEKARPRSGCWPAFPPAWRCRRSLGCSATLTCP